MAAGLSSELERSSRSGGIVGLIALVVIGLAGIAVRSRPLEPARPVGSEAIEAIAADGSRHARLWEDPLIAIGPQLRSLWSDLGKQQDAEAVRISALAGLVQSFQAVRPTERRSDPVRVIAVLLNDAPWPEAEQVRVEQRYAVLAGLAESDYVPMQRDRINGVFWPESPDLRRSPSDLPATRASGTSRTEAHQVAATSPPPSRAGSSARPPAVVPYEWFRHHAMSAPGSGRDQAQPTLPDVVVMWIPRAALRAHVNQVEAIDRASAALVGDVERLEVAVLSRGSSDLIDILQGLRPLTPESGAEPRVRVIEYAATMAPRQLRSELNKISWIGSIPDPTADYQMGREPDDRVRVQRVIGTDLDLAQLLAHEFRLRGIDLSGAEGRNDRIVLIHEWDSAWGRAFPSTLGAALSGDPDDPREVRSYTFTRGVDGRLPGESQESSGQSSGDQDSSRVTGATERPVGRGQLDAVRRLARRVRDENADVGTGRLRAVGVVGEWYDKLPIIQAMREELPEILIFTTDYDARLTHPSVSAITRNLVIATHFTDRLHPSIQRRTPPFRSGYQTSLMLATMLAAGHADAETAHAHWATLWIGADAATVVEPSPSDLDGGGGADGSGGAGSTPRRTTGPIPDPEMARLLEVGLAGARNLRSSTTDLDPFEHLWTAIGGHAVPESGVREDSAARSEPAARLQPELAPDVVLSVGSLGRHTAFGLGLLAVVATVALAVYAFDRSRLRGAQRELPPARTSPGGFALVLIALGAGAMLVTLITLPMNRLDESDALPVRGILVAVAILSAVAGAWQLGIRRVDEAPTVGVRAATRWIAVVVSMSLFAFALAFAITPLPEWISGSAEWLRRIDEPLILAGATSVVGLGLCFLVMSIARGAGGITSRSLGVIAIVVAATCVAVDWLRPFGEPTDRVLLWTAALLGSAVTGGFALAKCSVVSHRRGGEVSVLFDSRNIALLALAILAFVIIGAALSVAAVSPNGEPVALSEGISAWPTVLIRLLIVALSLAAIAVLWTDGARQAFALTRRYSLMPLEPALRLCRLSAATGEREPRPSLRERFSSSFLIGWRRGENTFGVDVWREYIARSRPAPVAMRVAMLTLLLAGVLALPAMSLLERQPVIRGEHFATIHTRMLWLSTLLLVIVTVICWDGVNAARRWLRNLLDVPLERRWPGAAVAEVWTRTGISGPAAQGWLTMRIIADRTRWVTTMLYLPFAMLFLAGVAVNNRFDGFVFSWSVASTLLVPAGLTLLAAWSLSRAADEARREQITQLRTSKRKSGDASLLIHCKDRKVIAECMRSSAAIRLIVGEGEASTAALMLVMDSDDPESGVHRGRLGDDRVPVTVAAVDDSTLRVDGPLADSTMGTAVCTEGLQLRLPSSRTQRVRCWVTRGDRVDAKRDAESVEVAIREIEAMNEGAFAGILNSPALRAALLPFGGLGAVQIIDRLLAG